MTRTAHTHFAKLEHESQGSSGGRVPEPRPPAADAPANVAGGNIPLDSPDLKSCTPVILIFKGGKEIEASNEPGWGWMDQRGVLIPMEEEPIAWRPI